MTTIWLIINIYVYVGLKSSDCQCKIQSLSHVHVSQVMTHLLATR